MASRWQAQAGLDDQRHDHGDQEHAPDLVSQRVHVAGPVVDAVEVEPVEQFGDAVVIEDGGAILGSLRLTARSRSPAAYDAGVVGVLGGQAPLRASELLPVSDFAARRSPAMSCCAVDRLAAPAASARCTSTYSTTPLVASDESPQPWWRESTRRRVVVTARAKSGVAAVQGGERRELAFEPQ